MAFHLAGGIRQIEFFGRGSAHGHGMWILDLNGLAYLTYSTATDDAAADAQSMERAANEMR
jgi:thiosulfate reductase cytochrome b subunit